MKNILLNRIKSILIILSAFALFAQSCGDCDLVGTTYPCRVREGTVPLFEPSLFVDTDGNITMVPRYNNQTFLFPIDNTSSGTLTNDNRYETDSYLDQFLILDQRLWTDTGTGEVLRAQLINQFPPNPIMVGDAMVVSVANDHSYALIRFYGNVARFPQRFLFEDAFRFCNQYLKEYKDVTGDTEFKMIASQATRYGVGIRYNNPTPIENSIRILNNANQDVTSQYLNVIPQNLLLDLGRERVVVGVDVQVTVGDVLYYRARNGKEFAVIISNIFEGSLDPNIQRVTIRFSELKGRGPNECKTSN